MNMKNLKILVLSLSFILQIVWMLLIPPYQGNDEERHFATVLFFTEEKRFISKNDQGLGFRESDWYQSLKKDIVDTEAHRIFANTNYHEDFENNPDLESEVEEINVSPGYPYPPGYYVISAIAGSLSSDIHTKLYIARLVSISFGTLCFYFIYKIIKLVTKNELLSTIGMGIAAFFPLFTYASAVANNDSMVGFATTFCIWATLKLQQKLSTKNILLLSIGLAFGYMSKPQFMPISIVFIGFALYKIIKDKAKGRRLISTIALLSLPSILAAPWYIYNIVQFKNIFPYVYDAGVGIYGLRPKTSVLSLANRPIYTYLPSLIKRWFIYLPARFASDFGQVDTYAAPWINNVFRLLFLIVVLFLIIKSFRYLKHRKIDYTNSVFLTTFIALESFYTYLWLRDSWKKGIATFPIFARYYFPLVSLGAYIILKVLSSIRILGNRYIVPFCFLTIILFYNFYCLSLVIIRYYL